MKTEDLKACPFCGERAAATRSIKKAATTGKGRNGNHVYKAMCTICLASTGLYEYEAEAIRRWNTRRGEADGEES